MALLYWLIFFTQQPVRVLLHYTFSFFFYTKIQIFRKLNRNSKIDEEYFVENGMKIEIEKTANS